MKATLEFSNNHQLKTVIHVLKGTVSTDQILSHLKEKLNSPEFRDDYHILVDVRQAELFDFHERMDDFANLINNFSQKINMKRRCAFLTDRPNHVVHSVLLISKLESQKTGMIFSVFSTEKAAYNWLSGY